MGYMMESIGMWLASGAGAVIRALLILLLALFVAWAVKNAVVKIFRKLPLSQKISADTALSIQEISGKSVYLLVFLLFVPGILDALNLDSVSQPILSVLAALWGYVPNMVAAGVILAAGFTVAKLVRQLLTHLFGTLKLNKLRAATELDPEKTAKLMDTAAYIVYVLILIPVVIVALQALKIDAISQPAVSMLTAIVNFIPNIVIGLVLIAIGCVIGKLGGQIVEKLVSASEIDAKITALLESSQMSAARTGEKSAGLHSDKTAWKFSRVVGMAVQTVIDIIFVVEGIRVLQLEVFTQIGTAVIGYLPRMLAASLILAGCFLASAAVGKLLSGKGKVCVTFAKAAIFTIGAFFALSQLGIAGTLVNAAFILIVGSLAVAFAVAFGLGGRDFAAQVLAELMYRHTDESGKRK